jgi:uncharacterized OsmC-like protein
MDADVLRATQAPLKKRYREDPSAALVTLHSSGRVASHGISCRIDSGRALTDAGLHPATGGDGTLACSGDMLLDALVACAGVTLRAVATSLGIALEDATVTAEGDLDVRGTLAIAKDAQVGFREIRLNFDLATGASDDECATLLRLTERYCVVLQTLSRATPTTAGFSRSAPPAPDERHGS